MRGREKPIDHEISRHPRYWRMRWRLRRLARRQRRNRERLNALLADRLVQGNDDLFESVNGQLVLREGATDA
jgi:hypothetical protein